MAHRPQTLHPAHAQQHPALTGGTIGLISADNPKFAQHATHVGHETLGQVMDSMGLDYEPTHGSYDGKPEQSYIVMNPSVEQMQQLGKQFGQEAVVHSTNGQPRYIYTNGPNEGLATQPPDPAQHFKFANERPSDFYTAIPGPHGEPYGYFSYNIDFNNPPQPVNPPAQQPAPALKHERLVEPPEAAYRLAKGIIEEYHQVLLDLRMRELAKAQVGQQVAPHREPGVHEPSGPPHQEPGVHERPAETAKKSEPQMAKKSKVTEMLKTQVAANKANGGQVTTAKAEVVASNKTNGGEVTTAKAETNAVKSRRANGGSVRVMTKDELELSESVCKGCGTKMSPVAASLSKGHGRCAKCLKSAIEKGEWKPRAGKDLTPAKTGSGGDPKALKKEAAKMSVPKAPKPPQAPGANPTMIKGELQKGMYGAPSTPKAGGAQASFDAARPAPASAGNPKAQPKDPSEYDAAAFRPASPGAAGALGPMSPPKPAGIKKPTLPIAGLQRVTGYKKTEIVPSNKTNGGKVTTA